MPIALPAGLVAEALAGFLIVAAVVAIAALVAALLSPLPIIGPAVSGRVNGAVLGAVARVVVWSNEAAQGLAQAVANPITAIWRQLDAMLTLDWQNAQALRAVVTVTIPRVVTWAWAAVQWGVAVANAYTDASRAAVVSWTAAWITQLVHYANALYADALARGAARADAIVNWTAAWITQLVQLVQAGDAQGARYAEALAQQAEAYAAGAVGVAVGALEGEIARERARADAEVGQVADWAARGFGDLARGIEAAEGRAEAYAAAAAGVVAVAVQALEDSPCQRFCGPLGGVGQYLQQLEESGLVLALIALAGEGAHDPGGTASGLVELFAAPLEAAGSEVRQAAGL